jgi:hypothetical protein
MAKAKTRIDEILARPWEKGYSSRGADLGRTSQWRGTPEVLHLQKMRLRGDYDTGGAYWGYTRGLYLYCAFSRETTTNNPPVRVFLRATDRENAIEKLERLLAVGFKIFKSHR